MAITGIICEYNPLHLGHKKQMDLIRQADPDGAIVCLMSGNFVQRGEPAVADKSLRAAAAVLCGADLVLELPVTAALSSAEGFAAEGVRILGGFCQNLSFGAENADTGAFMDAASALLSRQFPQYLQKHLDLGLSFPAARQAALRDMGVETLAGPNNILAVEYCKAILNQNSPMKPMAIQRQGDYHAPLPHPENPSATAVRALMFQSGAWLDYIPEEARECLDGATLHSLQYGERAILSRLRTMTDGEFEALPYGSEGLWRKFMHNCRKQASVESILTETKSKRYTRTRLNRMLMCAFLGITREQIEQSAPYTRVLAFNDRGRKLLKQARRSGTFLNVGEAVEDSYWELEKRVSDLYGLFAFQGPEQPGAEGKRRVFYHHVPDPDAFY